MRKSLLVLSFGFAVAFSGCSKNEKTETTETNTTATSSTEMDDPEARYRQQANRVTAKMAKDLNLEQDTATRQKVEEVYMTRARRAADLRERHTADTSGLHAELREINLETDRDFASILTPDQLKLYQTNRNTYYTELDDITILSSATDTQLSPDAKVKTKTEKDGDTKTEIEDGDTEIKIKQDADGETKVKTTTK